MKHYLSVVCILGALVIVLITKHPFALGIACALVVASIVAEEWR